MVEHRAPNREGLGSSPLGAQGFDAEQDTFTPQSTVKYPEYGGLVLTLMKNVDPEYIQTNKRTNKQTNKNINIKRTNI